METLKKFNSFVKEILRNNSRLYKMDILREYAHDEDIKFYLDFLFNSYIVTGISDKKLNKDLRLFVELPTESSYKNSIKSLLNYIKENNTGRSETIAACQEVLNSIEDDEERALLEGLITKNVKLGIDVTTINKCMNNYIPTFHVQLANKYFDKPEVVEGKEFTLTTKIDGGRIIALKKNNEVNFYTRAGQKYEGLVDLENEMLNKMPDNICLDGEITLLDKGNLESKDQYKQTMMITRKDGEKHGVRMLVFDIMDADEFINQECNTPYSQRRERLETLFNSSELTFFHLLDNLYTGKDTSKITEILNEQLSHGEEGVMINITNAPYQFKRTNDLLKVKKMQDIDLPIIGYEEGSNSNTGKLGAFIVDYKGNELKVGSGFSKELREEIWKHPQDYLGMTISIQYFEETTNQQGGTSLRFPVFLDFRYDK